MSKKQKAKWRQNKTFIHGRFGPYNEGDVYRSRDLLQRLVSSSDKPGIYTLLEKACNSNKRWGGFDRFEYFSRKPFSNDAIPGAEILQSAHGPCTSSKISSAPAAAGCLADLQRQESSASDGNGSQFVDDQGFKEEASTSTDRGFISQERIVKSSGKNGMQMQITCKQGSQLNSISSLSHTDTVIEDGEVIEIEDENEGENECQNNLGAEDSADIIIIEEDIVNEIEDGEIDDRSNKNSNAGSSKSEVKDLGNLRAGTQTTRLVCDLCRYHVDKEDKIKMKDHLKTEKHGFASLLKGYLNEVEFNIQSCLQSMMLKAGSEISTLVAVCPVCSEVYPSIWVCAVHYNKKHGKNGRTDAYGVGKVIDSKIVVINPFNHCDRCGRHFDCCKSLHRHWQDMPDHLPYDLPTMHQVNVFSCLYCETLYSSFITCRNHVIQGHRDRTSNSQALRIVYIEKPQQKLFLPKKCNDESPDWVRKSSSVASLISTSKKALQNRFPNSKGKVKMMKQNNHMYGY